MESHHGVEYDTVCLPSKAKKQMFEIRNMYILRGEGSFTTNDVLVKALDALYQIEKFSEISRTEKIKKVEEIKMVEGQEKLEAQIRTNNLMAEKIAEAKKQEGEVRSNGIPGQ